MSAMPLNSGARADIPGPPFWTNSRLQQLRPYSMTSSARASSEGGIVIPSASPPSSAPHDALGFLQQLRTLLQDLVDALWKRGPGPLAGALGDLGGAVRVDALKPLARGAVGARLAADDGAHGLKAQAGFLDDAAQ